MSSSVYTSRLSSGQIRLLEVVAGSSEDEPIHVHIFQTRVRDSVPFEALSYVWGDSKTKRTIVCRDCSIEVTSNLYDALLHLRLPNSGRIVWADAICINQDDLQERREQVYLMGEIYSRASRVVVWLGLDDGQSTAAAISALNTIHNACVSYAESIAGDLADMCNSGSELLAVRPRDLKISDELWLSVQRFFARPWFSRVWCVQEIIIGRDPLILVGENTISWERVGVAAAWIDKQVVLHDFDLPPDMPRILLDIPAFNAFCMFDRLDSNDHMLDTLKKFRSFLATDPRDKVYGLLGLAKAGTLEVDYARSLSEVYADVVIASIRDMENLDVLSFVKHDVAYNEHESFPSWVPQWNISPDVSSFIGGDYVDWCAGSAAPVVFNTPSPGTLELTGLLFDTVSTTEDVMHMSLFSGACSESQPHLFIRLWDEIAAQAPDNEALVLCPLARTLSGGINADYDRVVGGEEEVFIQFYSDFAGYIQHLLDSTGTQCQTVDPRDFSVVETDWKRYKIAASRACDERRFFRTHNGPYGIGPGCTKAGDVVCVFYGGKVPYVLRPVSGGSFRFLGESYVDDIIFGELLTNLKGPKPKEMKFSLR